MLRFGNAYLYRFGLSTGSYLDRKLKLFEGSTFESSK